MKKKKKIIKKMKIKSIIEWVVFIVIMLMVKSEYNYIDYFIESYTSIEEEIVNEKEKNEPSIETRVEEEKEIEEKERKEKEREREEKWRKELLIDIFLIGVVIIINIWNLK